MALTGSENKQSSKSEKAQAAICEATIDCLVEVGYANTSLNMVAARASFSKGALQYHYPSKEDLITATANHLLRRSIQTRADDSRRAIHTVADAVLFTWEKLVNTAPYRALLEILTATRTDMALQKRISPTLKEWNRAMDEQAISRYHSENGDEEVRQLMTMTRNFMRGLIIHERYGGKPSENLEQVKLWCELLQGRISLRKEHPKN